MTNRRSEIIALASADSYVTRFVEDIDQRICKQSSFSMHEIRERYYALYKITQFYTGCESYAKKSERSQQTFHETLADPRGGSFRALQAAIDFYPHMNLYDWEEAQSSLEAIMDIVDAMQEQDTWIA